MQFERNFIKISTKNVFYYRFFLKTNNKLCKIKQFAIFDRIIICKIRNS
jgi:hypothetical protein